MQRVTTLNITRDIMILLIHLNRNHNVTFSPSVRRLEMSTYVYAYDYESGLEEVPMYHVP